MYYFTISLLSYLLGTYVKPNEICTNNDKHEK